MGDRKIRIVSIAIVAGAFAVCLVAFPWIDYAISSTVFHKKIRHVISHRGNGFGEPENSIEGVTKARDHGYASEIDVRLSKEGTVYVIHDGTLDRTFGNTCKGSFYEKLDAELDACGVPTLQSFLAIPRVQLMFDIKSSNWDETEHIARLILNLLDNNQRARHIFFLSHFYDSKSKPAFIDYFSEVTVFFHCGNFEHAKTIGAHIMDKTKHGVALSFRSLRDHDRLVRYLTRHKFMLDTFTVPHPRLTFGIPITSVETDNAPEFDDTKETGSLIGNVYLAHIVGITLAFGAAFGSLVLVHKIMKEKNRSSEILSFL